MKKDNVSNITGCILSDLRKGRGLTQKEFAKAFNVSEGTVAHYEQGITVPNTEMLEKFADFFHVNVDYLLGRCMLEIEYNKLNETLYGNMTIADMVNIVSIMSKDKKHYLFQTLSLLGDKNSKLK
ncbi:helix-turn-helix domain-containing protein [Ruminococcus flavefaciens]|uniref:Helix-turn-helix protein n=1 Tax=Ruminococcus flavefaciens TaxID=1265 RepID=A0A315XX73_RUMFL|nr:helix-turn-helix transcriptional regulator [Ruminococcus flavefaciens]PWJ11941.1 helix-turn-helix protein [Ruminococcus flavefaciens]SSA50222.1 Helix-turn-helix [Ruminococcus flavefaciens]